MLDFRPKGRTRNYFARGEQRKLLALVFAVGLVLFLIEEAAHPQRWGWLLQGAGQPGAAGGDPQRLAKVEQPPELRRRATAPGEFIAEADHKDELPPQKEFFDGVDRELLSHVRDDTAFRSSESSAFFHLLKILQSTSEDELERASIGPVSFTQLFTQPKEFRGDLVTIEGTVLRALSRTPAENDYGITQYTQLVIEPSDRAYAVIVYCLEPPQGFPLGEKLREPVKLTGFSYKRWAHLSEDKEIMTWPLLLSKTVDWRPAVAAGPAAAKGRAVNTELGGLAVALVLAVLASLVVVAFVFNATRRKTRFVMPHPKPDSLRELTGQEPAPDVRQQLAELAQRDQG
ncbi:MAG TPA: hypothetical protein VHC22_26830 [Pirellulales bacterium]|nr:hypothetical protein [Pirellulales bacterium]